MPINTTRDLMELARFQENLKSFSGHAGRPGHRGGSAPKGGSSVSSAAKQEDPSWKKTDSGYDATFSGEKASLNKVEGKWQLTFRGKSYKLPKKADFSHAEGIIKQLIG